MNKIWEKIRRDILILYTKIETHTLYLSPPPTWTQNNRINRVSSRQVYLSTNLTRTMKLQLWKRNRAPFILIHMFKCGRYGFLNHLFSWQVFMNFSPGCFQGCLEALDMSNYSNVATAPRSIVQLLGKWVHHLQPEKGSWSVASPKLWMPNLLFQLLQIKTCALFESCITK